MNSDPWFSYLGHSVVLLPAPRRPPRPGRPRVGWLELGGGEGAEGALVLLLELLGEQRIVDVLNGDGGEDVGNQCGLSRGRRGRHSVCGGKEHYCSCRGAEATSWVH